jgi:hypothetical protein
MALPQMMIGKGLGIFTYTKKQMKPVVYRYILPHVQGIFIRFVGESIF